MEKGHAGWGEDTETSLGDGRTGQPHPAWAPKQLLFDLWQGSSLGFASLHSAPCLQEAEDSLPRGTGDRQPECPVPQ